MKFKKHILGNYLKPII